MRFSPPPAMAISPDYSRCSTPTSHCTRMPLRSRRASRGPAMGALCWRRRFAARMRSRRPSEVAREPRSSALIDGAPGLVFAPGGRPFVVFDFVVEGGRITAIDLIGDLDTIARIDSYMWNPSLGGGGGRTM